MTESKPVMGYALALVLGAGLVGTALSVKPWKALYLRRRWIDEPGPRKIHTEATALSGGAAVLTGFLVATLILWIVLWMKRPPASAGADISPVMLLGIILGAIGIFLVGFWDDVSDLRPRTKFGGQLLVAGGIVFLGVRLPVLVEWPVFQIAASILFVVFMINAMNFLDNMNGLCAGLGAIATVSLAAWGLTMGRPMLSAICLAATGACAGFVPFNFPRAAVFLGDAGSHVVGFLAVTLALLACTPPPVAGEADRSLLPLLVLFVPLYDIIQVVVTRSWGGRPIYMGDTNHVSHQLVRAGASPPVAVLVLWMVAIGAGVAVVVLGRIAGL